MIGIVVSRADEVSARIGDHLLAGADWTAVADDRYRTDGFELREFDGMHVDLENVADAFDDPDLVVFASRHSGDTGRLLSAHFTGNVGVAELGGEERTLPEAAPSALKHVLLALDRYAPDGWDVAMECTHHGPTTVGAPSMFVELGSGPEQWDDPDGAEAVATAILALRDWRPAARDPERTVVVFGGNHYAPRPTRLLLETDAAVGHVAADWSLADLDPAADRTVIERAFEASGTDLALFDGDYPGVAATIEDLGHRIVSETWLRETDGRPMALVEAVESALSTVDDGLRFGAAESAPGELFVSALPADLVSACNAIDLEDTLAAVGRHAVAYETVESGNRVSGAAAFPDENAYRAFVDEAVAILERGFDSVGREDGTIVAERAAFDPAAAREAGVPEGPAFGRLAAGESVTVDGRTVEPERVHTTERVRFDV